MLSKVTHNAETKVTTSQDYTEPAYISSHITCYIDWQTINQYRLVTHIKVTPPSDYTKSEYATFHIYHIYNTNWQPITHDALSHCSHFIKNRLKK